MKVSYRTKFSDLIAFNFFHIFGSPIFKGFIVIILLIGIIPNWQSVIKVVPEESLTYKIIMFFILELIPVLFAYFTIGLFLVLGNISKMNKTILTDCTIILQDDMILTESRYARSEVQWAAIQKARQSRSHIFLYAQQNGALVIPKRAFDSEDAFYQFFKKCQEKVKIQQLANKAVKV